MHHVAIKYTPRNTRRDGARASRQEMAMLSHKRPHGYSRRRHRRVGWIIRLTEREKRHLESRSAVQIPSTCCYCYLRLQSVPPRIGMLLRRMRRGNAPTTLRPVPGKPPVLISTSTSSRCLRCFCVRDRVPSEIPTVTPAAAVAHTCAPPRATAVGTQHRVVPQDRTCTRRKGQQVFVHSDPRKVLLTLASHGPAKQSS